MPDTSNVQPDQSADLTGVHRVRGLRVSKGVFRSGRFAGRQYVRFVYELCDVPGRQEATQMLPWQPGIGFFETNFRLLTGMSWRQFKERVAQENMDVDAKRRFFLGLFTDVEYDAELRRNGRWLNVWRLERRLGAPAAPGEAESERTEAHVQQQPPPDTPREGQSQQAPRGAGEDEITAQILKLAPEVGLEGGAEVDRLAIEEFGVPLASMSASDKVILLELMQEHKMLGEPFEFQEGN